MSSQILRRKVRIVQRGPEEGGSVAERAWRVALARAMRDEAGLAAEIAGLSLARMSLAEVLDLPPDRAMILMLEGPEEGTGILMLSPEVTAAIVETLTLGRCAPGQPEMRKPTRTDAAMVSPLAELAMRNLEIGLEEESDLVWTSDFHYASCLEDARPLALLLEDVPYKVMQAELSLAEGARRGKATLILPAEGKGRRPQRSPQHRADAQAAAAFNAQFTAQVQAATARVDAVLARVSLPIAQAMALAEDMIIPLPEAALDQISLEGQDGRRLAVVRLGQQRGARAVRLCDPALPKAEGGGTGPQSTADAWNTDKDQAPRTDAPAPAPEDLPMPLAATGS